MGLQDQNWETSQQLLEWSVNVKHVMSDFYPMYFTFQVISHSINCESRPWGKQPWSNENGSLSSGCVTQSTQQSIFLFD